MSKTLEKSLLALLAATGLTVAETPEVSFSGYFLSGMTGGWSDGLSDPGSYAAYNEIDLTTSIKFDSKTTVDIYTTMYDGYATSGDAWWPEVYFDGITLTYAFTEDFSFMGGDLVWGAGDFGYYLYKRSYSVISETAVRGIGFSTMGLTVMTGMLGSEQWGSYVSYEVPTAEGVSLGLHAAYYGLAGEMIDEESGEVLGKFQVPDAIQAGATFGFEQDAFSLNATAGVMKMGEYTGFAVLVEPFYDMGVMNVLASFYMEDEGADEAFDENGDPVVNGAMINDVDDEGKPAQSDMYFYIEPGFPINDVLSFGVTLEYHDPDSDVKEDENFQTWPTLYLAPAGDVLFLATAGMTKPLGDVENKDATFGFGLELSGSF